MATFPRIATIIDTAIGGVLTVIILKLWKSVGKSVTWPTDTGAIMTLTTLDAVVAQVPWLLALIAIAALWYARRIHRSAAETSDTIELIKAKAADRDAKARLLREARMRDKQADRRASEQRTTLAAKQTQERVPAQATNPADENAEALRVLAILDGMANEMAIWVAEQRERPIAERNQGPAGYVADYVRAWRMRFQHRLEQLTRELKRDNDLRQIAQYIEHASRAADIEQFESAVITLRSMAQAIRQDRRTVATSLPPDPRLKEISELWAQAFAIVEQMFKKNCYAARDAEAVNESARVMIAACEKWLSENAVHQLTQVTAAKGWTTERNWNYGKNLKEQEANPNIHFDCLASHMVLRACMVALSTFERQLKRASAPMEHE